MPSLYLDRSDCRLLFRNLCLELHLEGEVLQSIPFGLVDRIIVLSSVQIDSKVLLQCADRKIPIMFLSKRDWEAFALVSGPESADSRRRVAQTVCFLDNSWRTGFCLILIRAKLLSQIRALQRLQAERVEARMQALKVAQQIGSSLASMREAKSPSIPFLRGLEGSAARSYFAAFQSVFPPSWKFHARTRRPPLDPANALLSLGYTLLHGLAAQSIRGAGLDPAIGYLHAPSHGRQSLACDLVEILRVRVDALVWDLARSRKIRLDHFQTDSSRCSLGKTGRAVFYSEFEPIQLSAQKHLRHAAAAIARAVDQVAIPREFNDEENVVS